MRFVYLLEGEIPVKTFLSDMSSCFSRKMPDANIINIIIKINTKLNFKVNYLYFKNRY